MSFRDSLKRFSTEKQNLILHVSETIGFAADRVSLAAFVALAVSIIILVARHNPHTLSEAGQALHISIRLACGSVVLGLVMSQIAQTVKSVQMQDS